MFSESTLSKLLCFCMQIDILQAHLEYEYLRLGQGTLREL